MADLDIDDVRREIERALSNDEVWHLAATYRTWGANGEAIVEVWQHPEYGYTVHGRDGAEDGLTPRTCTPSNPEPDAVLAVQVSHLRQLTFAPQDDD